MRLSYLAEWQKLYEPPKTPEVIVKIHGSGYPKCNSTGKVRFPSSEDAMSVVRAKTRNAKRKESRAYYCEFCDGFHLTSIASQKALRDKKTSLKRKRIKNGK